MDPVTRPAGGDLMTSTFLPLLTVFRACGVLLIASVVVGCAGTNSGSRQGRPAKASIPAPSLTGEPGCFYARQVQNFRVLDRSNLIVYAPNDRNAYHVQISPPSVDLVSTEGLAFLNDRICGYAGDRMAISGAISTRPLAVIAVSRLSPESLQSLRGGVAGAPPPAPQPGAGAVIEGEGQPPGESAPDPAPDPAADSTAEK
jgi:hypothetical protein